MNILGFQDLITNIVTAQLGLFPRGKQITFSNTLLQTFG